MNEQQLLELWLSLPVEWDPGLREHELQLAEGSFGFQFPPDLRALLAERLPLRLQDGNTNFPNWRDPFGQETVECMAWPWLGLAIDIGQHDQFWLEAWGAKPDSVRERMEIARKAYEQAPRMIPVYGHRFLLADPTRSGNPVLSVWQTDVIYYGFDLCSYLQHEFFGIELEQRLPEQHAGMGLWREIMDQA